jgi:S1-C subfamily serine protease
VRKQLLTLVTAAAIFVSAVYFCPVSNLLRTSDSPRYVCERAARSEVLIRSALGTGSGVTLIRYTKAGNKVVFVWTAGHVVVGLNEVLVVKPIRNRVSKIGEKTFKAVVVMRDERLDIALLQLDSSAAAHFASAEFDGNQPPALGSRIFHIGNFFGDFADGLVSEGVLGQTGVGAGIEGFPWPVADATTMVTAPGSSGGPIFRGDNSKVIGLLVGGRRDVPLNIFVPVRAMRTLAPWAVDNTYCPSLGELLTLQVRARVEPPKETLLDLLGIR